MPLVRIDVPDTMSPEKRSLIGDIVYETMHEVISVPEGDESRVHVRPQDVVIVLTEVAKENWSFGNGEAQYA